MSNFQKFVEMQAKACNVEKELMRRLIYANPEYLHKPVREVKVICFEEACPIYQLDDAVNLIKKAADGTYVKPNKTLQDIQREREEFAERMYDKFMDFFC